MNIDNHHNFVQLDISLKQLWMTFGLLRQLFKEIRILETKNKHIASITRRNIRLEVAKQKENRQKNPKKNTHNSQATKNLSAFVDMLAIANRESEQFSQNQKIKLVEMSCDLNVDVNSRFQLREDRKSKEIATIYEDPSFHQLKTQHQKKFVLDIIKKVYHREQTFEYPHLSDFFMEKRPKKPTLTSTQHLDKLDMQTRTQVMNILNGKQVVAPQYREIYEYYFTEIPSQQISFSNYLNSLYILLDFNNTERDWFANSFQRENNQMIKEQKRKERLEKHHKTLKQGEQLAKKIQQQLRNQDTKDSRERPRQKSYFERKSSNRGKKY